MITLFIEKSNPLTQNFYNDLISSLQFHRLTCSCGNSGCLSVHGYYHRFIKTAFGKTRFRICRVKCENCGKTHAILLSSMVPYSQLSLSDHIDIIDAYESKTPTTSALKDSDSIDESTFRYVVNKYRKYWRERLRSANIKTYPFSTLVMNCFYYYSKQFMQIKRTPNKLFIDTT